MQTDNNYLTKKDVYTGNELVALMHENTANAFDLVANHIEKFNIPTVEIIDLLRENRDAMLAQISVCQIRDFLNNE